MRYALFIYCILVNIYIISSIIVPDYKASDGDGLRLDSATGLLIN